MEKMMLTVLVSGLLLGSLCPAFGADVTSSEGWVDPILTPGTDAVAWTEVTASPTPTGRSAMGWIGDYVYLFGNESYPTAALYWHVPTETWGNSTPHPSGSSDNWTGTVLGGELYVLGRYNMSNPTNEFWKFTPDGSGTGTWTRLADYPMTISMLALAARPPNTIVAAGGYNGSSGVNNVYAYDVANDNWVAYPSMPQARLCNGGAVINDTFYVVGGLETGGYNYTNTLYMLDPSTATWSTRASLPQAVAFNWPSVTVYGHKLYQVGGGGGYGSWPALNAVQVYDPATDSWALETPLPAANGTNGACLVIGTDPYLLSTGGWDGGGYIGRTFKGTDLPGVEEDEAAISHEPSGISLCQNYPNPLGAGGTTIQFSVPSCQLPVSLKVYDLSGRAVRTLFESATGDGLPLTTVAWDGKDSIGQDVPSGVYFYRLTAGNLESARKLMVLR